MPYTVPMSVGVSTGGNTQGNTGITGTQMVLVGTNNITLSQATDAAGGTISISGAAGGGGGNFSGGVSNLGNTAGSTGVTGTRVVFVGTNNNSLSQSTDANGATISFNDTMPSFSLGISTDGNTFGSTGITGTRVQLVASHGIELSGSTDANGATISIQQANTIDFFLPLNADAQNSAVWVSENAVSGWFGTPAFQPVMQHGGNFPGRMTINTFGQLFSVSGSTATMSSAHTVSFFVGLYTRNGASLSLLNSASTSWGSNAGNANLSTVFAGKRWLTIHSSKWSVQPVVSENQYWIGSFIRTSGAVMQTLAAFGVSRHGSNSMSNASGTIGVATTSGTSAGIMPHYGLWTATTSGLPNAVGEADLNKGAIGGVFYPLYYFNNARATF